MRSDCTLAHYRLEGVTHLLMLEAYLDDSGDENLHAIAVAGAIGRKEAWSFFMSDWASKLSAFGVPELHMTDLFASRKAFAGWARDDPRKADLLEALLALMRRHELMPLGYALAVPAWRNAAAAVKESLGGRAYYVCLQALLRKVATEATVRTDQVFVYIAHKPKHVGIAASLFTMLKSQYGTLFDVSLSRTPREMPALQVGDFVAWEMTRSYLDRDLDGPGDRQTFQALQQMAPAGYIDWLPGGALRTEEEMQGP